MPTPRVTIDDLPEYTSPVSTDLVIVQNAGVTRKMPISALQAVTDVVWVGVAEPDSDDIELWYDTDAPVAADPMTGLTVDTEESFRLIMYSNGDVRAIPVWATNPATPAGLARVVRIGSVTLTWTDTDEPQHVIRRNGSIIATVGAVSTYRDSNVVVGQTYTYDIRAISGYGLLSEFTDTVTAFIDPALNVAPTATITTWPTTVAVGNRALIRVNGYDADAQTLATILSTDVGTLIPSHDPTMWYLEPTT